MQKFIKPDEKTIGRMTVQTLSNLIGTLKDQRAELVEPLDSQIEFYENLLAKKKEAENAKTAGTV